MRPANWETARTRTVASPIQVGTVATWTAIAAGSNFVVAIRSDTAGLYTWGGNSSGQLGNGNQASVTSPEQIEPGTTFTYVAAGADFALAISSGALWSWGDNTYGELGNGIDDAQQSRPSEILSSGAHGRPSPPGGISPSPWLPTVLSGRGGTIAAAS